MDSIKNYVRGSGQLMKQKFGKAGTNLDKLDQQGNWMSRIIVNIERLHFQMADEEGIEVLFFFFFRNMASLILVNSFLVIEWIPPYS